MSAAPAPDELDAWVSAGTPGELRHMFAKLRWDDRRTAVQRLAAAAAKACADKLPAQGALLTFIKRLAEDVQSQLRVHGEDELDAVLISAWEAAPAAVGVYLLLRRHPEAITEQAIARARHLFLRPGALQPDADKTLCVLAVLGILMRDPAHGAKAHLEWQGILQHDGDLPAAARHLARARVLAERAGDSAAVRDISLTTARLLERVGDLAGAAAAYEATGYQGDGLAAVPVLERLARAYRQLGQTRLALTRIDQAISLIGQLNDPARLLSAMHLRGLLLEDDGDYLAGGEQFDATAAAARATGLFDPEFRASTSAAMSFMKRQRWNEAVDRYQQVLLRAASASRPNLVAAAQNNLGQVLLQVGRPADAARQFGPAMMYGIGNGDNNRAAYAAIGLSDAYGDLGDRQAAREMHQLAAVFVQQSDLDDLYPMWVTRLSKHEADSVQALSAAHAVARDAGNLRLELTLTAALAAALERADREGEAESLCADSAAAALRANPQSPWGLRLTVEQARLVAKDPARAAEAYRLVEKGSRLADQRIDRAVSDLARSEIVADLADLIGLKIDLLNRRGTELVPSGVNPRDVAFDAHQMAKSPLLVSVLARGRPGPTVPAHAAEVASLLARVDQEAALVSFFIDQERTACFVVRPGEAEPSVTIIDVGRAEVESAVARIRRAFNGNPDEFPPYPPIRGNQPWKRPLSMLDGLGERLLAFLPQVEGAAVICIAPHGPLHLLPWPALRLPDGRYLVEKHAVVNLPSATMLRYLPAGRDARRAGRRRALVAGVAAAGDLHPEFFEHDADLLAGYEITSLPGAAATKNAVLAALAGHDVVHLTCHGFFEPRRPSESGVVLSDGEARPPRDPHALPVNRRGQFVLTAEELRHRSLSAELTVLRACVSGVQHVQNSADELQGLTTSLLSAGSATVIASLWNVDQRSSGELLRAFYRNWLPAGRGTTGRTKWQALADAQRGFINGPDEHWRHPYHWAPLAMIGDWR